MKRLLKSSWAILLALSAATFSLNACHTMEGAGQDLEEAGQEIDEEVHDAVD